MGDEDQRTDEQISAVRNAYYLYFEAMNTNEEYKYKEAIAGFTKAIEAYIDFEFFYLRAMCYLKIDDKKSACEDFASYVKYTYPGNQKEVDKYCK